MNDETHPSETAPQESPKSLAASSNEASTEASTPPETAPSGGSLVTLTERQQTTVATALTIVSAVVILFAVLGAGWLVAGFVGRFSGVLLPRIGGRPVST